METGAVEFLNNLKRPLWSIYCTMPSHQSLLIDNIPKELSPEALLRYVLWKLSHTWRMNTKYGGVLTFEFDKETGYGEDISDAILLGMSEIYHENK